MGNMTPIQLPGEELLRYVAYSVAMVSEAIAVVIIAAAILTAAWGTLKDTLHPNRDHPWTDVRLTLARSLALGLEFLLAADVVRTAVAPTWEDIGRLAAIAIIRTGLNFFLHRDIEEVEKSDQGDRDQTSRPAPGQRERRAA